MKRIEFKLSMPGRNSWNGRWSGEDRNYTIVRKLSDKAAALLLGGKDTGYWHYSWPDGWAAGVSARVVPAGERLRKSDGFSGYDWMVASIVVRGKILADHQIAQAEAQP